MPSPTRILAALGVAALLAAGCGDDSEPSTATTTTSDSPTTSSTTTATVPSTTTSTSPSSTTTTTQPTPPGEPIPEGELPGESFDIGPREGDVLAVIGVRFDDVLNVRRAPGTDQDVVAELDNLADDVVATGRGRMLTRSIWWEVTTANGVIGWVGSSFVAKTGATSDVTAQVIAELGYTPEEATMSDLGLLVGETIDTDPDVPSSMVMVVEADETGDLGEVTFDLVGLGDDTTRAVRLHVFGQPLDSGDGFGLKSVEQTDMCDPARGPSADGLCA